MPRLSLGLTIVLAFATVACKGANAPASTESTPAVSENGRESAVLAPAPSPYDALPEAARNHLNET